MTDTITLRAPDDWHVHLRDGAMLRAVLPFTAASFARAIAMPNLVPPVVTAADAAAYRERILAALLEGASFTPLMTAYLRDDTDPDDIEAGFRDGVLTAVKLYPAGATTNSHGGVRDIEKAMPVLERMARIGLPLCVHGEVTTPDVYFTFDEAHRTDETYVNRGSGLPASGSLHAGHVGEQGIVGEAIRFFRHEDSGFTAGVGCPTLCATGPVGGNAHTAEEYLDIASLVPRAQALALAILRLPAAAT